MTCLGASMAPEVLESVGLFGSVCFQNASTFILAPPLFDLIGVEALRFPANPVVVINRTLVFPGGDC